MDGAGGVGGKRGGAGGGDVRSEKSNHSHFRPELCWPAVLARFVVWKVRKLSELVANAQVPTSVYSYNVSGKQYLVSNSTSCRRNPSFGRTSRCFRTWRDENQMLLRVMRNFRKVLDTDGGGWWKKGKCSEILLKDTTVTTTQTELGILFW